MTTTFNSRSRIRLIGLVFLGLAVRVVMPAGYMPVPIGEGGPFVLCPGGLPGVNFFLASSNNSHNHHDHGKDDGGNANAWEFCPFGAVFGSPGLITETTAAVHSFDTFVPPTEPPATLRSIAARRYCARGPPETKPLHT